MRPIRLSDQSAWRGVRNANRDWLSRWDATPPALLVGTTPSYAAMVRHLRREARAGRQLPFVLEYDGRLVGQITVSGIVRGSAQFGSVGYWVDEAHAGRGIVPRAVAMVVDHCFGPVGLHRIEVAVRPENHSSLRVVAKLGFTEIGLAPRYLHIDGAWRDHRLFAITAEDVPLGLVNRLHAG